MTQPTQNNDMRDFMLTVRDALLMVVRFIEKRYMSTKSQTQPVRFSAPDTTKP